MGAGRSKKADEELDEDYKHNLSKPVEEARIDTIIEKALRQIVAKDAQEESRLTAIEILGNLAYVADVRGVMKVGEYLPTFLSLIQPDQRPSKELVCRVISALSKIGYEMGEVQENLFLLGGYRILLYYMTSTESTPTVKKWAAYCSCCCLGDVYEPLDYLKKNLSNKEVKSLAEMKWEKVWTRNWGLCLAKLLGKTRGFRTSEGGEKDLLDENDITEVHPVMTPQTGSPRATLGALADTSEFENFMSRGTRLDPDKAKKNNQSYTSSAATEEILTDSTTIVTGAFSDSDRAELDQEGRANGVKVAKFADVGRMRRGQKEAEETVIRGAGVTGQDEKMEKRNEGVNVDVKPNDKAVNPKIRSEMKRGGAARPADNSPFSLKPSDVAKSNAPLVVRPKTGSQAPKSDDPASRPADDDASKEGGRSGEQGYPEQNLSAEKMTSTNAHVFSKGLNNATRLKLEAFSIGSSDGSFSEGEVIIRDITARNSTDDSEANATDTSLSEEVALIKDKSDSRK